MRGRNLLLLAAVVVILGGYILLFERHQPTSDEARRSADRVFPGLAPEEGESVAIAGSRGRLRLERSDRVWQIVEPIEYPADAGTVDALLRSLVDLRSERRLAPGEVDLAAYALDEPGLTVVMTTASGVEHRLQVGDEAALGSLRAVTTGDGVVRMCPSFFATDLDQGLDHWRDRDVVDLFADQVASVELVEGEDRVAIVSSGGRWRLLQPVDDLADRDHVQALISDLNALRVEAFPDPDLGPADLGLQPPGARITVVRRDDDEPLVLELGDEREVDGTTRVACRRNGSDLLWVDNRLKTSLDRAPVRWRSRRVFPFDTWNVDGLTIAHGEVFVDLERSDGTWRDPSGGEVDGGEVLDRLSGLAELEGIAFDLISPEAAPATTLTVELGSRDGGVPEPVTFGVYPPLTPGGDAVVEVTGRPSAMGVTASAVDAIVADLDRLTASSSAAVEDGESP